MTRRRGRDLPALLCIADLRRVEQCGGHDQIRAVRLAAPGGIAVFRMEFGAATRSREPSRPRRATVLRQRQGCRSAHPGLVSRGFTVREVGRAEGKLTIALTPPRGDEKALGTLFQDMWCGRLAGLSAENLGFVGNEMDPSAKQPPTKFVLYGSPQTVSRVAEEAQQRGWTVGPVAPSGDGRSFTTLATSSTMTQGAYSAFLDTLFSWKLKDASLAEVQDGKLFRSQEDD